jgi:hypothetical protein
MLIIGRTTPLQPGIRLIGEVRFQRLHQSRFANTRLATQQDHLAKPLFDLRPAFKQQLYFVLPPHQRREPAGTGHIEAGLHSTLAQDTIDRGGRQYADEWMRAQGVADEEPPDQAVGDRADHDRIGCGKPLQPSGQMGGLAERQLFAPGAAAHVSYDHQPGMDAQTHG